MCGDRATAPVENIWCEKIRGCSYRGATRLRRAFTDLRDVYAGNTLGKHFAEEREVAKAELSDELCDLRIVLAEARTESAKLPK